MTTRRRPRTYSVERSEAAARTVSSVYLDRTPLPTVGECRVRKCTPGQAVEYASGTEFGLLTGFGATVVEALEDVRAQAVRFGIAPPREAVDAAGNVVAEVEEEECPTCEGCHPPELPCLPAPSAEAEDRLTYDRRA